MQMWEELRTRGGRSGALAPVASEQRVSQLIARQGPDAATGYQMLIAEYDGEPAGMAALVGGPLGLFVETPVARIDYLHVRPAFVRRGVGHALVEAAAAYADSVGADHVSVTVFPQHREANRFYAKIGFAPMVVRRVVPVATLRRRLGAAHDSSSPARRAGLLARRRSVVRARRASTPA
jgi:GNAT superfamily N-acetyltransferase